MTVDTTPFVEQYKQIVKEKYHLELSDEYATECFFALVSLLEAIYGPIDNKNISAK